MGGNTLIQLPPNLMPLLFETELVTLDDPAATFVGLSFRDAGDAFCFHGLVSLDVATELRDQLTAHLLDATR